MTVTDVATTTVSSTIADYLDRTMDDEYVKSSVVGILLMTSPWSQHRRGGTAS